MVKHNDTRSNKFERAVRQRDRHECQFCHRDEGDGVELKIHQIVPTTGDDTTLSNYQLLCSKHYRQAVNRQEAN